MSLPNVVIVTGKCSQSKKTFGLRLEEQLANQWLIDWVFAMQDAMVKREGYDTNQISGTFNFWENYPGCPYCRANSLVLCYCQRVSCYQSEASTYTCPDCGHTGPLGGYIESLQAGGDR